MMSYKSMIEDLKNDSSNRLYLFYGEEQYLIEETLYRFKRKIVDEQFEAFNYQIFNGEEFHIDAFVDACETLPFMGQNRMIVVKDLDWLSEKGKSTATKEEEEMMVNCLESLPDTTYLFFVMSKEVDHRRKIVKWVQKYGKKVEFAKLKGNEIAQWIREKVGEYGKTIEPQSIAFFLDVTGYLENNSKMRLRDLDNEIKKIVSYIGDKERIEKEDIDLITIRSTESNIFRMLEYIGTNESEKSLKIFDEMLLEGEPIAKIGYMIIRQFRFLYQVKLMESLGYTPAEISSKLNIQPFQTRKYIQQAMNFDSRTLRRALDYCLEMDKNIKKGYMDARLGMELLIRQFAK